MDTVEFFPKLIMENIYKVELHAHLFGSLSEEGIVELFKSRKDAFQFTGDISKVISSKLNSQRSLNECFEVFRFMHLLADNLETIKEITKRVVNEFHRDKILYLELRTTPKHLESVYTKRQYLLTVIEAIRESEENVEITVRLLVSFDRSRGVEDAWDTLKVTKDILREEIPQKYICGIDVSGNPNSLSLIDFIPVLRESKALGLKLAVHLLEIENKVAFDEAHAVIEEKLVDRIGHGAFLYKDSLHESVHASRIPIEFCITSNLRCGLIRDVEDHPIKFWHEKGHPFSICTDDKGIFSTSVSRELSIYQQITGTNMKDIERMTLSAVDFSFLQADQKEKLKNSIVYSFSNDVC